MTDRKRTRTFNAERKSQLKKRTAIQRDTVAAITRLLKISEQRIKVRLANLPTDWESYYLPQLQLEIKQILRDFSVQASLPLGRAADKSWSAGINLIDKPLEAGGIRIAAVVPLIDKRQLLAMQSFMTDRMEDVGITLANQINGELGLTAIGTQSTGEAITKIARRLQKGGRARAITIVRTELGRAYSVAGQARMDQAREFLPGLKKQWRRSGKLHSRPGHDAADGQVQESDEPFIINGIELMFPRDPAGPIGETINCGCESLPFMDDWEVKNPGRMPFSAEELASSAFKRGLAELDTTL